MFPAPVRGDRVVVVGRRGRRDSARAHRVVVVVGEVPREVQISRPPPVAADPAAGDGGERGPGEGQGAQGAPHGRRHRHWKMSDEIVRDGADGEEGAGIDLGAVAEVQDLDLVRISCSNSE